jgi:cellulose synthase/poly-beta-1,6-N-acetylglucosamine synthase-like glycosyltransferase
MRYLASVARMVKKSNKSQVKALDQEAALPGVSVILSARNEGANLRPYLQAILEQDYPDFEVIVVNDASEDDTQQVLDAYIPRYKNLHVTFVPREARVPSSKKLALTLAVKAAKNELLLLTDADCRPESKYWIRSMVNGFHLDDAQSTVEVVLGFGAYFKDKTWLNSLIQYDTLFNGLQYLGMAIQGKPYMGVGRNLAYRRQTFIQNNGFMGMLNELAGDDDLFVNKVATQHNTAVVVDVDSITWSEPKTSFREWFQQKRRHLSVSPHYKLSTRLRLLLEPLSRGLFYAGILCVLCFQNFYTCMFALLLLLARLIMQMCVLNRAASHFGCPKLGIEIIWHDICLPLVTLWMLLSNPFKARKKW